MSLFKYTLMTQRITKSYCESWCNRHTPCTLLPTPTFQRPTGTVIIDEIGGWNALHLKLSLRAARAQTERVKQSRRLIIKHDEIASLAVARHFPLAMTCIFGVLKRSCHPERSEGLPRGECKVHRFFATLRMTVGYVRLSPLRGKISVATYIPINLSRVIKFCTASPMVLLKQAYMVLPSSCQLLIQLAYSAKKSSA